MSKLKHTRIPAIAARVIAAGSLLLAALPAIAADSYTGKVTDVSDGDTLVIGSGGRVRVVQLAGIDAPELAQEYGKDARDFVKELTKGKRVTVEILESKSSTSLVAKVSVDGKDIGATLVESGLAWSEQNSNADLRSAQEKAKSGKQGLWAGTSPKAPWDYRNQA